MFNLLIFVILIFVNFNNLAGALQFKGNEIQRYPFMYVDGIPGLNYPVLLFADAVLGDKCITWTSRYHADNRTNINFHNVIVFIKENIPISNSSISNIQKNKYKQLKNPIIWKSNGLGLDTPVLQIQYCDQILQNMNSIKMKIRYQESKYKTFYINRIHQYKVSTAVCTTSTLLDLWSAKPWIEHHRNLGIGRFNIYINNYIPKILLNNNNESMNSNNQYDVNVYNSIQYLLKQNDVQLIEWPYPFKGKYTYIYIILYII